MTALPCPACGYDCRPEWEMAQRAAEIASQQQRKVFIARHVICNGCDVFWEVEHGVSIDGVGPERLVPVEVGA